MNKMLGFLPFGSETELSALSAIRFLVDTVELSFSEQLLTATFQISLAAGTSHFTKIHYSGVRGGRTIDSL